MLILYSNLDESRGPCWADGRGDQAVVWFSSLLWNYYGSEFICQYYRFAESWFFLKTYCNTCLGRCSPRRNCQGFEGRCCIIPVQWSWKAKENQTKIGANDAPEIPWSAKTTFKPVAEDPIAYTREDSEIFEVFGVILRKITAFRRSMINLTSSTTTTSSRSSSDLRGPIS